MTNDSEPRDRVLVRASGGWCGFLLVAGLAISGCAAQWTPRTATPTVALQWPYAPAPPKVTYLHSLSGLDRAADVGSVLRAVAFGSESEDRDAFVLPVAVAVGSDGRLAVADLGRRCVHLYVPLEGRYVRLNGADDDPLLSPVAVAFDDAQGLFVSDSVGKVLAFGADGTFRFALRKAGERALARPTGLAYDRERKALYVVDTLASEIDVFEQDGRFAFSFGSRGDGAGQLNFPTHAFCSPRGELYVTDAMNFRVQIFDRDGRWLGGFGRHGDGSGDLAMPKGVVVDRDGVVYVVDGIFDNLQLFDRTGRFLLTVGARGTGFGELWLPSGAFIDDEDRLYVCDTYNRRIQVFRITRDYADARS